MNRLTAVAFSGTLVLFGGSAFAAATAPPATSYTKQQAYAGRLDYYESWRNVMGPNSKASSDRRSRAATTTCNIKP